MPESVLANYDFFREGHAGLRAEFVKSAKDFSQSNPKQVFGVGDPMASVFFVGDGALDVYVAGYTGRNVTLYNVAPGELCPINLGAVLSSGTSLANAKTRGDFKAAVVPATDFRRIIMHHADFRGFVIGCLASRFESIVRQIAEVTTRSVDARMERYFADHLDECDEHGTLRATNEQIGSEIGASREVVNRKLRALQKAGLIELGRGQVRLLRPDRLLRSVDISPRPKS